MASDPWGRFWAGTMAYDFSPGAGSLWRLNNDFSCSLQWQRLTISNGLAWSLDRRCLYFIDSPTLTVMAFPLTSTGHLLFFGGPDLDQLFITTARRGLDLYALAEQPLAGGLFQMSLGIKGCRAQEFRI